MLPASCAGRTPRESPAGRVNVLGAGFDAVTAEQALCLARRWLQGETGLHQVVTANPETILKARRSPELQRVLGCAALVVADGVGVVWASRRLGTALPGRVAGIELAEGLLEYCAASGYPVFLLGGRPAAPGRAGVAEAAAVALAGRWPGLPVAGTWHGYFGPGDEPAVLEAVARARPALLLCGMGCPRQELWLARHASFLEQCGVRVAIGVGGALDVWSGQVRRAPALFRRLGLEWLWRLGQDPRRVGRQLQLVRFVLEVLTHARS